MKDVHGCFSTLKILATVKLLGCKPEELTGFSTLKILATVKQNVYPVFTGFCSSTLKILATVKQGVDCFALFIVLVPLRF